MSAPVPDGLLRTRLTLRQPGTALPEPGPDGLVPVPVTAVGGEETAGGTAAVPGWRENAVSGADPARDAGTGTEAGTGTGDPTSPSPAPDTAPAEVPRAWALVLYAAGLIVGGFRNLMLTPPDLLWDYVKWAWGARWMESVKRDRWPEWLWWTLLLLGYAYHFFLGLPVHAACSAGIALFRRPITGIPAGICILYLVFRH